jgi:hypothetical protein
MEMIELQDKFAVRMAGSVKTAWDEIRVHYENAEIHGAQRAVFSAWSMLNGVKHSLTLPLEAMDLLAKLKQSRPEGQSENWVWLEFFMDNSGRYRFDYKYDAPPLISEQLKYSN